jgi:hypothetical protein
VLSPLFLARVVRDRVYEKIGYYPRPPSELGTTYLWGRSLALSCEAFGGVPYVMYGIEGRPHLLDWSTYENIREGNRVWIRAEDLLAFNERILPTVTSRFVLITGESDYRLPSDFPGAAATLAQSGRIIRWFSVNYDGSAHGDLITGIPLGLNYAHMNNVELNGRFPRWRARRVDMKLPSLQDAAWEALVRGAPPLEQRVRTAVADFHLNNSSRNRRYGESRDDIRRQLADNPHIAWIPYRGTVAWILDQYARHAFVISPHGKGLDCYRTWEALFAGSIPIVKASPLDALYRDLPVAIVNDWSEITKSRLEDWLDRFGPAFDRGPLRHALSLSYWVSRLARV